MLEREGEGERGPRVERWMWNLWIIKEETEDGVFLASDHRLLRPSPGGHSVSFPAPEPKFPSLVAH